MKYRGKALELLWRLRVDMHRSMQTRAVAVVALVALVVAIVFSLVSMLSVRSSLLRQVSEQSRTDFSNQVVHAQNDLDSADGPANVQYQEMVNDMASASQNDGPSNLVGVYVWSRSTSIDEIIPVSTDPSYTALISDDMRSAVVSNHADAVFYQPVSLMDRRNGNVPGAVLGTVLHFGAVGDLEFFALYSYANQQQSLTQIQINLLVVSLTLSLMMSVLVWFVLRGIVHPVSKVAMTAETLAAGDLQARVVVDRNDEIGTLQRSFNAMADALDQKIDELEDLSATQRRFVSDVSHELRTPVTTMRMGADLLESHKTEFRPSTRRAVELLSGQIVRFQDLLSDLLEISRYDAGYAVLDLADVDLREPIHEACDQMANIARSKGVTIRQLLPHVQVFVRVDSRRIIRIIRNLLANAVDFCEGHPIEVRLAVNRRAAVIGVRDYGLGMDAEQVTHVFDRFWRADPSRSRVTGGTGLGLSIAMTDARLHHGTIKVRSVPGEGTWFLVVLPRDPEHGELDERDLPVDFVPGEHLLRIVGGFGVSYQSPILTGEGEKS